MLLNNPEYVKIGDKKYKINTSYKTAIKCNEICIDETIGDTERAMAFIYELFGDEGLNHPEDYEKLMELGTRYLLLDEEKEEDNEEPDMDFIQDMDYIATSFMSDYKIQLTDDMHWWTFMNLINGLSNSEFGNCCVLNRIRNLRNITDKEISEIKDKKERDKIIKARNKVALKKKNKLTKQQEESINEIIKLAGLE